MTRPARLVAVVGTGTEIGKTWVGAALLRAWRAAGMSVAARKPVQSFDPSAGEPTDAEVLGAATGEAPAVVCPSHRGLPVPMAPPMATAALGLDPIALADLLSEITWPDGIDIGLVETVGGVRAPCTEDGDSAAVAARLQPDLVVLVADAGLGTISHVRLAVEALAPLPVVVVLNRFDPAEELHVRNAEWLAQRDGLAVVTVGRPGWEDAVLSADTQRSPRELAW
ncbi:MAG: ATP-dependent dethiobiotin synthetase BioD [Acidimicrobiia bacterium]